jgi:CRP/FNR family transcriptional regulator, nitrogen fixation regulation protein
MGVAYVTPTNPLRATLPARKDFDFLHVLEGIANIRRFNRGAEICHSEQPATCWFRLVSGAARRYAVQPGGRHQIISLVLPGDFFGFTNEHCYGCITEAVRDGTIIAEYPRSRVVELANGNPQVAWAVCHLASEAVSKSEKQVLIISRATALGKVGMFVLEMAARLTASPSDLVALPVSRYVIADYLAVSVETVCRCLSELKRQGVIELVSARQINIVDREALEDQEWKEDPNGGCWHCSGQIDGRA